MEGVVGLLRRCVGRSLGFATNLDTLDRDKQEQQRAAELVSGVINLSHSRIRNSPNKLIQALSITNRVQELDISCNGLTEIPDSIGKLRQLQKLDVSTNHLTEILDSIGKLRQLEELRLSDNQLNAISGAIGELTKLKFFDIFDNQLKSIPGAIG